MNSRTLTSRVANMRHDIGRLCRSVVSMSFMLCGAAFAQAQNQTNSVESIQPATLNGAEAVRVEFSQPLKAVPTGFVIQSPARIALDLPGVGNGLGKSLVDVSQGNVKSVNVVQSGERTRLVINLKQSSSYKATIQGKTLMVLLDPAVTNGPVAVESPRFAESQNRDIQALRDIDFRRAADGVGRISVELPSNQIGVDIRQQGQNLVVEFMKSTLPEGLRKRLDVSDFGTPVQTVTTFQTSDRVRMVIEPKGYWEHSAYQSDNKFVVEVRSVKTDPDKLTQGLGYNGEKISLNFQNIEVRSLLQVIADFTNFNIITSDSVSGAVTLRLKDVPWDQALDIILQSKALGMRKNGNVILIGPKDELSAKEKQELEARVQISTLEPLKTQHFQLNYTKAADIATLLTSRGVGAAAGTAGSRLLSDRGSVIAEARTNQIFVTDIPSKLDAVQQMLSKLDIPVRQVLIEARIVEADDSFGRSLGVKLGGNDLRGVNGGNAGYTLSGNNRVAIGTNYNNVVGTTGGQSGSVDTSGNFVNLPAVGQNGYSAATFALSLFNSSANRFLNLEISALEAEGRGKVVSSPRVITADQIKALIEMGTELPYQQATSSGATSISFRKANLKLEVTPQITPEGNIIMDVDVNKDSVGQSTAAGFAIDTKHVKTQVLVENGGTVVIGGIFELTELDSVTKVPLLGDVPVVGNLFKAKQKTVKKSELLIFITPKMLSEKLTANR